MLFDSAPMLISFDTGIIVNCVLSQESLGLVAKMWGQSGHKFVISSEAEDESIRKLCRTFNYQRDDAIKEVGDVIKTLKIERKVAEQIDYIEGDKLTRKYGKDEFGRDICHDPDNTIIAHVKRLEVELVLTCDGKFAGICQSEGMQTFLTYPIN